jgi:hypothetical protein
MAPTAFFVCSNNAIAMPSPHHQVLEPVNPHLRKSKAAKNAHESDFLVVNSNKYENQYTRGSSFARSTPAWKGATATAVSEAVAPSSCIVA